MNRIAQALLSDFVKSHLAGQTLTLSEQFEHFAAYLCIGPLTETAFSTADAVVSSDAQPSIDALAIIVNGSIVNDSDDVDALVDVNGYLDVDFVFVQAKTSDGFSVASFGHMGDFVSAFFSSCCPTTATEAVRAKFELKEHIYDQATRFKRRNPRVFCYYVSTGELSEANVDFAEKAALIEARLQTTQLFQVARAETIGVSRLQKLNQQMSNVLSRKIHFPKKLSLPDIPKVSQALVGVLPAKEFLILVRGESDAALSSIFYDNVRDWQGMNDVNTGMEKCLADTEARSRFVLMNNGVTVIARKVQQTGESVVLENYQIVNGCQTSNVLWKNREQLSESVLVPIRIVETDDDQVTRDIIRATNSQTEVSQSQLLAITDFQKQLEQHFASYDQ